MLASALVPLDGSAAAETILTVLPPLLPEGAAVILLRVLPPFEPLLAGLLDQLTSAPLGPARRAAAQADLDRACRRLAADRLRCTSDIVEGDPAAQILRVAAEQYVDLIAMTSHGRGAVGRAVFGSVADRVARHAPTPTLLVRPGAADHAAPLRIKRVVVPLDGSELAEAALPAAAVLAERLAAPIVAMQAVDAELVHAPLANLDLPDLGEQVARARLEATRTELQTVVDRLRKQGLMASAEALDGSPFFVLAEALRPDDLLVLTSHGRGGVQRWLLGSVAEKLTRTAPCPVLLVPAPGRGRGVV
ncbi:MAG TPA: universal stress protein [Thermomicrobiales bacterium]|nr:universal stress protein [Thermomicrobiales bacterium]